MFYDLKHLRRSIVIFFIIGCLSVEIQGQKGKKFKLHDNCYERQKQKMNIDYCPCINKEKKACNENLKAMTSVQVLKHFFYHSLENAFKQPGSIDDITMYPCPLSGCFEKPFHNKLQLLTHIALELKHCGMLKVAWHTDDRNFLIFTVLQELSQESQNQPSSYFFITEDLSTLGDTASGKDVHLSLDWDKDSK